MVISQIELHAFRNYSSLLVNPGASLTVFVGPNATGKTNAIEAIQLLTTGRSFRNPRWSDVVMWGSDPALLKMVTSSTSADSTIEMMITAAGVRSYRLNSAPRRRFSDISGLVPSVVFTPDDLSLAKGPAEQRRSAIDELGEQLSKTYGSIKRDYMRTVRQRNAALRDAAYGSETLKVLDEQLVSLGSSLCVHRHRLVDRVAAAAITVYGDLAPSEELTVRYDSRLLEPETSPATMSFETVAQVFKEALVARKGDERARQTTLVGPHRDDIIFSVDGRDARSFASQGQQRTIALAWKWAEVKVIEEIAHRVPVLLLDDVMSELDSSRRAALTGLMQGGIQTFVTTTNTGYFDPILLTDAHIIETERGQ